MRQVGLAKKILNRYAKNVMPLVNAEVDLLVLFWDLTQGQA